MHMDRILLVDADPVSRRALVEQLRIEGFEVEAVQPAALDEAVWQRCALLLLYVHGDLRDDVTLLSWLRSARGRAPVIVVSSQGEQAARRRAFELGALDYIAGSSDPRELAVRVRVALHRRPPPRDDAMPDIGDFLKRHDALRDIDDLFNDHWAVAARGTDDAFAPIDTTLTDST